MATKPTASSFAALPNSGKVLVLIALLAIVSAGYYLGVHMGLEQEAEEAQRRHEVLYTRNSGI